MEKLFRKNKTSPLLKTPEKDFQNCTKTNKMRGKTRTGDDSGLIFFSGRLLGHCDSHSFLCLQEPLLCSHEENVPREPPGTISRNFLQTSNSSAA